MEFQNLQNDGQNQQAIQNNSKNKLNSALYENSEIQKIEFLCNPTQKRRYINETSNSNLNYQNSNESSSIVDEQNDETIQIKQFKAMQKQSKFEQIQKYENQPTKIQAQSTNLLYQDKRILQNDSQNNKIHTNLILKIKRQLTNRNYQVKENKEEIGGEFVLQVTKQIGKDNNKDYLALIRLIKIQNSSQKIFKKLEFLNLLQQTTKYIQMHDYFYLSLNEHPQSIIFVTVLLESINTQNFLLYFNKIIDFFQKNKYYLGKYIAEGGFGVVFDGKIYQNNKIQEVIFKIQFTDKQNINESEEEYNIMKGFEENINLIRAIDYKKIDKNVSVILMEKCEYGLILLRTYKIIHLDIKPSNILINRYGIHVFSDFGTSTKNKNDQPIQVKGYTKSFAPKEVINKGDVNYESDVFSLGKTLQFVFKEYEKLKIFNQNEKAMLEKFKQILKDYALREQVSERKTCLELHKAFYEVVEFEENIEFLQYYIDKIRLILSQTCYDSNKDIQFFYEVSIYYYEKILDLKKKIKKSHILSFVDENKSLSISSQIDEISSKQDPEWHLYTASTLNKLSLFHQKEVGKEYSLQSLQIIGDIFKGDTFIKAVYLNTLSWCYSSLQESLQALKLQEESLKIRSNIYLLKHTKVAVALNNLGTLYQNYDLSKSLKYQILSLKIRKSLFEDNHPCLARSLDCVGQCYLNMGNLEKAKKYLYRSYFMRRTIYQGDIYCITTSLKNIAQYHLKSREFIKAIFFFKKYFQMIRNLKSDIEYMLQKSLRLTQLLDYANQTWEFQEQDENQRFQLYSSIFEITKK
ncbi:kinase domain protein (macronuclear) [Tetrahymena thermophila SB210]|uniref:Kinase domain protein n=1 Tax=Tetrahymena thermophila (strain SB210) TaxID=312017 RepID=Q23BT2_TETTS|nr:kinase domain protein [Tetrahymena thermophila SB210]EAR94036.2 kinase domain protein [Tetrahymena thermophila SB210]|eukprot:XP_001014281.2 kinase domain protein [Tetrahymena thermophila SB210]